VSFRRQLYGMRRSLGLRGTRSVSDQFLRVRRRRCPGDRDVGGAGAGWTAKQFQRRPSETGARGSNAIPLPGTRSATTCETHSSPTAARRASLAATSTATPVTQLGVRTTAPACRPNDLSRMEGKPWLAPARRQCLSEREAAGDRRTRPGEARPGGIGCERLRTEPGADAGDQLRQRSALGRVVHAEYGAEKTL